MNKTYYITTPIYYPSGKWHLGHSYTTVCCDAIARYKRMMGYDVYYLTGTDEHGSKIEKRATESGVKPKEFVDVLAADIQRLWKTLNISNTGFIRTTDSAHKAAVSKIFKALYDKGDIYKSNYEGMYCTPCEAFWTKSQLKDGKCPDCGREVTSACEESYFFRLSKYSERIEKLLTETDFLQPQMRVNEMINNFIRPGLADLCVSRTSFKWGIPVDFDKNHVVYVWIDALSNYITALGAFSNDDSLLKKYWPADLHMVGKEIVRFHAIIWPAILMALDLPLPKKVYGHGWLLFSGDKMSKSKGNVVDPFVLTDRYGVDAVRYYLLREIPFGQDGIYSNESFLQRINSDLVNDLSNLVSRTTAMCRQYFGGIVPKPNAREPIDAELISLAESLHKRVDAEMESLAVNKALEEIFKLVSRANKYIDETAPWKLKGEERLNTVIYNLLEAIRIAAVMLSPFLPDSSQRILDCIGADESQRTYESVKTFGALSQNKTTEGKLFMRHDIKKELLELDALADDKPAASDAAAKPSKQPTDSKADNKADSKAADQITIEEFFKTKLKTALVTECSRVEGADKLLRLTLKVGAETKTVVSGIAKHYTPEYMVGKHVVFVANLVPAKLRGIVSEGMILCADDGKRLVFVSPEGAVDDGSEVR